MKELVRHLATAALTLCWLAGIPTAQAGERWGADYFPNLPLITQDGEVVRFFDDLIKDKIVAINFIYTTCPDTCPLETAQLVKVQRILGDRLGRDVFFYSITIDPEIDTPPVLQEYRGRFGARWTFLTGKDADIVQIRRKLGLYIEEIQDGSKNHNVSMIIGNQATGRWMKRSPFENPHVLADQIGNWLDGWKSPQKGDDYANAPALRQISKGEQLFRTRCATCHTLTGHEPEGALGPDLLGVNRQREMEWLLDWLRAPDQMLRKRDPIAIALYKKYNFMAMPNLRLTKDEALALIEYIDEETRRISGPPAGTGPDRATTPASAGGATESQGDVVGVMDAWVREGDPKARVNAGYMTLVNVGSGDVTLVGVESTAFERIEIHEMSLVDGLMRMRRLSAVSVPRNGQARFEPGGRHLMLMGPREHLTAGRTVEMTLTFKSGRQQTVMVKVDDR